MIIKLAQFSTEVSSELEKEAGLWSAIKARGAASLDKHQLTQIVDELAKKKDFVKNTGIGRLAYVGDKAKAVVNDVAGGDVTGALGGKVNKGVEFLKGHKAPIAGAAILGGGAAAYSRRKK
jgi:hypothetical protein